MLKQLNFNFGGRIVLRAVYKICIPHSYLLLDQAAQDLFMRVVLIKYLVYFQSFVYCNPLYHK